MHQQHAADLFLLVLDRVQIGALGQAARIDAGKGQRTDERVVHDFERQQRQRRRIRRFAGVGLVRSEEHTSELQSLMRISYAVFCLKKKKNKNIKQSAERYRQIKVNRAY